MASYSYNSIKGRLATIMVLLLVVFAASSIYVSIQSNRINRHFYMLSHHAEPTITLTFITNWQLSVIMLDINEIFITGNDSLFEKKLADIDEPYRLAKMIQAHCDTLGLGEVVKPESLQKFNDFKAYISSEYAVNKEMRLAFGKDSAHNYFLNNQYAKLKSKFWDTHGVVSSNLFRDHKEMLQDKVTQMVDLFSVITVLLTIVGIVLVVLFWLNIQRFVNGTVQKISEVIQHLSKGRLIKDEKTKYGEAGEILHATNKLVDHLQSASTFAENIGKGDFTQHFEPTSEDDTLGKSLLNMRNELMRFKMEDEQRNWVNIGLAELGEVIRKNNDSLSALCDAFLKALVKYTQVNQGSVYLLKDAAQENACLERMSAYAYGKKKYIEEKIEPGDGLIGQVFLDKEYLILTDIPNDYIKITSGLGESLPNCVLIVPCMNDQACVGVLELASFDNLEAYKVDFIQKISNTFASVVFTAGNQERNHKLVEELTSKTEQMHSQEEELRQNMEELLATQEEMQHKSQEFKEFVDVVNAFTIIIDLSKDGDILHVNDKFIENTGYSKDEIVGQKHTYYVPEEAIVNGSFEALWQELKIGKNVVKDVLRKKKDGTRFWLRASYMPVFDHQNQIKRISCLCFDITEEKVKMLALEKDHSF